MGVALVTGSSLYGCSPSNVAPEASAPGHESEVVQDEPRARTGGLSEEQRKQVFIRMLEAERRATAEADAKYPVTDVRRNAEYTQELLERYHAEVANEYSVTTDQLGWIAEEGIKNQWPRRRR